VREFQGGVDEILRESEVDTLRREIDAAKRAATFDQAGETPNPPAEPPRMIGRADTSPGAGETGAANDDQPKT